LATLDNPPTLPLFDATNSTKKTNNDLQNSNIQTSNIQTSNASYPSPFILMPFPFYYLNMFNQQNLQLL